MDFDLNKIYSKVQSLIDSGDRELAVFTVYNLLKSPFREKLKIPQIDDLYHKLGICLFYTKHKTHGLDVLDHLHLNGKGISNTYLNMSYYMVPLVTRRKHRIQAKAPKVMGTDKFYMPMNPSLVKYKNGFFGVCRFVNYVQSNASVFNFFSLDRCCRTRLCALIMDENLNIISQTILTDESKRPVFLGSRVKNFEDAIPFVFNDKIMMLSNALDGSSRGVSQMFLCDIDIEKSCISQAKCLSNITTGHQKNWLPLIENKKLKYLYRMSNPLIIYDSEMKAQEQIRQDYNFNFRGSGGVLDYKYAGMKGHLVMIHEVFNIPRGRVYTHRWVWFDSKFKIKYLSHPLWLSHKGVEYCRSLCSSYKEDEVILGVGIEDREAWYYIVEKKEIEKLLIPIERITNFSW